MRRTIIVVVGLFTIVGVAAPVQATVATKRKPPVALAGTVNDKGTGAAHRGAAKISQHDFSFTKTFVKVKAGTTVSVTVKNKGNAQHTFTVDAASGDTPIVDEQLSPGDSVTFDVSVPGDGSAVAFYCRFHVGSGMQGALFSQAGTRAQESDRKKASTGDGRYGDSSGNGY